MLKTVRLLLIAGVVALGCAGDEATGPDGNGGHATVAGARIFDAADTDVTSALQLAAGGTTRLRVRFTDAQGVLVSGLEAGHDAALVFEPAGFATATPVTGQKFYFDVTTQSPAGTTGSVRVGYGHAGNADESLFGPFGVNVN